MVKPTRHAWRVRNHDLRQRMRHRAVDDGSNGAPRRRGRDEFPALEVGPAQRDEQCARGQGAAVGGHRAIGTIVSHQLAARLRRGVAQRPLHALSPLLARFT
jgi:hypothetical protein